MEVNVLGLIATVLFIIIPTSFLLILYVKTASQSQCNIFLNLVFKTKFKKILHFYFYYYKINLISFHRNVAQFGSVRVLGTRGRRFESCHSDFSKINYLRPQFSWQNVGFQNLMLWVQVLQGVLFFIIKLKNKI